jgi:hypothetical protein
MKTYRHDAKLFFAIPFVLGLVVFGAFEVWTFEGELRGGNVMRYGFAAFAVLFTSLALYLFLNFAIVRYHFTQEGVMVKKLWSTTVRAWSELKKPTINSNLKYVVVRDREDKVVIFSSLDYFKDIREFVQTIQTKAEG